MSGGAGADTFLYLSRDDSRIVNGRQQDAIPDFNVDQDTIDLQRLEHQRGEYAHRERQRRGFRRVDANGNGVFEEGVRTSSPTSGTVQLSP